MKNFVSSQEPNMLDLAAAEIKGGGRLQYSTFSIFSFSYTQPALPLSISLFQLLLEVFQDTVETRI